MTLQTQRVRTLEQVRRVAEGNEPVDFAVAERESAYEFIRRTLVEFDYTALGKGRQGRGEGVLVEDDGAVSGAGDAPGVAAPRDRAHSRPSMRWAGTALRAPRFGGGRALAGRCGSVDEFTQYAHIGCCASHLRALPRPRLRAYYTPEHDKGLLWNDPALSINGRLRRKWRWTQTRITNTRGFPSSRWASSDAGYSASLTDGSRVPA